MTAYTEKQYVEEMIATRRKIHQTPEEGWTEFQTTWLVVERLRALGLKVLLGTQVINPKAVMGRDPKLLKPPSSVRWLPAFRRVLLMKRAATRALLRCSKPAAPVP